uniref:Integrase catalytic domain-containing protein n=1 Tax=Cacopsylla melanoneura TaxID=428564 RepID=A0A8D9DY12_9HEMI
MCNMITHKACKLLGLEVQPSLENITGIGSDTKPVHGEVKFNFHSNFDTRMNFNIKALVVNDIVEKLPVQPVDYSSLNYLHGLNFADNGFMLPGDIDGILGSPIYPYLMEPGTQLVFGTQNQPVAMSTKLGYVVMGTAPVLAGSSKQFCMFQKTSLENNFSKFWELDQINDCKITLMSPEEKLCEEHFVSNVMRDEDGRYSVALPFKESPSELGDSFNMASKRFFALERKLNKKLELGKEYKAAMADLLDKGFMQKAADQSDKSGFFIPHHAVEKPDSTSTKLRVVFDGSAPSSSGKSLNDLLLCGPKLYNDLFLMLANFRLFPFALNGDIAKMFLQIKMNENDWKYQKLLWRVSSDHPPEIYILTTVIFGLRPSPYLAQRIVRQLICDDGKDFPHALQMENSLYMDDCVASFLTEEEARFFYNDVMNLFKKGGFTFTKWGSNSPKIMEGIPLEYQASTWQEGNMNSKILGMHWNGSNDCFLFKVNKALQVKCTKRSVLSCILTIFDPLGLLAPVVFWTKLLIRELCCLKMDWDSTPPTHIVKSWQLFQAQLPLLETLQLPRHIGLDVDCKFQLIGFADASQLGYACQIYGRVTFPDGNVVVNLICAKSRVAPLKVESIPRLELCGVLLLANLMKLILASFSLRYKIDSYFCFTDSTVVLCWVHGSPHLWNVFVANRVSKIQQDLDCNNIYHINGTENPADCLSRGEMPAQLVENKMYFHGPEWLLEDVTCWPFKKYCDVKMVEMPEAKKSVVMVSLEKSSFKNPLQELFIKCSSWTKLLRIVIYFLRFIGKITSCMLGDNLDVAEKFIVSLVQKESFGSELQGLKKSGSCSGAIGKLNPFLDGNILRVGGRLSNSNLEFGQQHPMLLPAYHPVTKLIVLYYHVINFHTGPYLLLSIVRQKFWIVGGRNLVRRVVQKCNICFKFAPKFINPQMADLPAARVTGLKAFGNTACDFLGPLSIVHQRKRGCRPVKAYICLFICLATKALHLEVVSDMSTAAFLNAFKRFLCRRGPVKTMLTDNGTNFLGAKNHLNEVYELLQSDGCKQAFASELMENRIEWRFNPPSSPHFGGIFEANVKSFKTHFLKVLGTQLLTYEELLTVTVQIEGILNSRPLCKLSPDPSDCRPLTPNHFLNFSDLRYVPASDVVDINLNRLTRFQLLDQMVQSFWRRWTNEYLTDLQVREKWNSRVKNLEPGLVVIIKQDNTPPLSWPMGVITEVFPGTDGTVRVASVRTSRGNLKRPVCKLAPLPSQ